MLMSHRKSHSQGSIPFSWEDKPGICKTPNNECPLYKGTFSLQTINQESPSSINLDKKIPLPPCLSQPPRRSTSGKGLRLQEDPFLVAYKECTKSDKSCKLKQVKNKKGVGFDFCFRRSISIFTCRGSSDVSDDSCFKLSKFPRFPAYKDRSLTLEDEQKRGFNYESWL